MARASGRVARRRGGRRRADRVARRGGGRIAAGVGLLPELKTPEPAGDARSAARAPEPDYWLGGGRSLGLGLDLSRIQPSISSKVVSAPTVPQGAVAARLIDPE